MSKCLSIKTENGLEKIARANDVATAIKLALLQKQANQSFAPNDEIWITESGEFIVPYDGVYEVTVINAGGGSFIISNEVTSSGGHSGGIKTFLKYYNKGTKVPVVIGAGGLGQIANPLNLNFLVGGFSYFDNISGDDRTSFAATLHRNPPGNPYNIAAAGAGAGGGTAYGISPNGITGKKGEGHFYGAGGGSEWYNASSGESYVGDGAPGAIRLRFFNPEKAVLPTINDTDLIPFIELLQRVENIEKALMESRMYNTEEWIEESGTWTAPVDGYYEVMVIGGGDGVHYIPVINTLQAGSSGSYGTKLFYLKKGDVISVTVGAGGQHYIDGVGSVSIKYGGITKFGDLLSSYEFLSAQAGSTITFPGSDTTREFWAFGGGFGGGLCSNRNADGSAYFTVDGKYYGAGGGGRTGQSYNTDETRQLGDGYQGVIRIRYYDSNKENN